MMAEKTDNNVPEQTRQSKDYSINFNAENTSVQRGASISDDYTRHECVLGKKNSIHSCDSKYSSRKCTVPIREASISDDVFCTRHECAISTDNVNENQRRDRHRVAWDMGTSEDMSPGRNDSFSSIRSFDSGYASRKNSVNSIMYEDEQTKLCQHQIRPAAQTESTPKI